MKSRKGITLTMLAVTVFVIIIILTTTITGVIISLNITKGKEIKANLIKVQTEYAKRYAFEKRPGEQNTDTELIKRILKTDRIEEYQSPRLPRINSSHWREKWITLDYYTLTKLGLKVGEREKYVIEVNSFATYAEYKGLNKIGNEELFVEGVRNIQDSLKILQ